MNYPLYSGERIATLLDPEEASKLIGIAPQTLARWRSEKQGPPYLKIGRKVYYRRTELDKWIDRQMVDHGE